MSKRLWTFITVITQISIFSLYLGTSNNNLETTKFSKGIRISKKKKSKYFRETLRSNFKRFWNKLILELKTKQKTTEQQKLKTAWYNRKLHESITLGIHMFVQLWNLFPEELKTTKQNRGKYRKCLQCYKAKLTCSSRSVQ